MDAYDMPKEFQRLQAQDMGKVGAIQDLLRGIDKILGKGAAAPVKETVVVQQSAASAALGVEPLLKRGCLALEDGEWRKADEFFEQVLNLDPENGDVYAGKLCAGLKYRSLSAIAQDPETWGGTDGTSNGNYKKVLRYGSQALKAEIGGYIAAAVDLWKGDIYTAACKAMDETDYQTAMGGFNSIKGYRDADEKSAEYAFSISFGVLSIIIHPFNQVVFLPQFLTERMSFIRFYTIFSGFSKVKTHVLSSVFAWHHINAMFIGPSGCDNMPGPSV